MIYDLLGYAAAVFMGMVLGLMGGGGSILTVPILVYAFSIPPITATGYSLFIVGVTSLFGVFNYLSHIRFKIGFAFVLPTLLGVFSARQWLVPALPTHILGIPKDTFLMLLFATVMLLASVSMIRGRKETLQEDTEEVSFTHPSQLLKIVIPGLLLGVIPTLPNKVTIYE